MRITALVGSHVNTNLSSVMVGTHVYLCMCGFDSVMVVADLALAIKNLCWREVLNPLLLDSVNIW
jgi:hypothetical protein